MSSMGWLMVLLFFPASLGLMGRVINGEGLASQLLAIAFLLFSVEQTRMAIVDLEKILAVRQQVRDRQVRDGQVRDGQVRDDRLNHFYRVTVSTIVLELMGFYAAAIWLGWGAVLVLLSQVWFNSFANIQLYPSNVSPIEPCGISQRIPVLMADGVALILIGLWIAKIAPLWMASGILSLAIAFGFVKYVVPLRKLVILNTKT